MGSIGGYADSARYLAFVGLVTSACGGQAETNPDESPSSGGTSAAGGSGTTTGPEPALHPEDLRFQSIEAGQTEYCGITRDDQRLVCVRDDAISFEATGPFSAFDMDDQVPGWDYRCAVRQTGELNCFGNLAIAPPTGTFTKVSVGAFSACADTTCWIPPEIGGVDPEVFGMQYSVSMWSFCTLLGPLHAACWGRSGEDLLPPEAHYVTVVAAPLSGCAAVYATEPAVAPQEPPSTREAMLTRNGIACFSADDASWKVDGLFDWLDVNANQDGCAVGMPPGETERHLTCWGAFAGSIPGNHSPDITDLSVSLSQACVLDQDGKVSCFDAAP